MRNVIGYGAMCEQFTPTDLVAWCRLAEEHGFGSHMVSDHFNPWVPSQGQSAFVWTLLGALGTQTKFDFGTGVTAPGYRIHPVVVAHAAATTAAMFPGRFWLGLGAGEALNEHVTAEYWPEAPERLERLDECLDIIQRLLSGKKVRHQGKYYRVESCKLYTRSEVPPPIYIATAGPINATKTGKNADGIIIPGASDDKLKMLLEKFEGGAREAGKDPSKMPKILQVHVSWHESQAEAEAQAVREWPNGGMAFAKADIRTPEDFEGMAKIVTLENFRNRVLMSSNLDDHRAHMQRFIDLGFTAIYVHNVGRNQEAFIKAYGRDVIPKLKWPS
ncbi:MAG: TIGR03557 family F420-dependent LLM class oxidoreductase [Candidatus Xenobia bacterium]